MGQFDAPNFNVPLAANIATNSKFAAIGNATVYGDVLTNGVPLMEMGPLLQTHLTLKVRLSMIITNRLIPFMHLSGTA